MKRIPKPFVLLPVIGLVIVAGIVAIRFIPHSPFPIPHQTSQKATYYCPMHPTYVSDRPGDCPICYMKLVKKEISQQSAVSSQQKKTSAADICYLHNCPKVHEGRLCPMLVVAKAGEKVTCPVCGTHVVDKPPAGKKILYWTDPMIPGYKADGPGKSPMGMDLVPVYAEEAATVIGGDAPTGYAPVLLSPYKQQLIGVKTAEVTRRHLTKTILTVGTVAHDPELYQAQAEYLQAVAAQERAQQSGNAEVVAQAARLVDAAQVRLRHLGLNEELMQELVARGEPERGLLFTQPGDSVWVYAQAYEYELPLLSLGQAVVIDAAAMPGSTFDGVLRAMDPRVDPKTRTTRIRVQVEDSEGRLTPEMYVNVRLRVDLGEVAAVPEEAVFDTGTRKIVFVDKGEGLFEPRDVVVGATADGYGQLVSGVALGERVVTSGNFLIDSESRLKAALDILSPEPAGGEQPHVH